VTPVALVKGIVRSRVAYVSIDEDSVDRFAKDLVRQNDHIHRLDRRVLSVACKLSRVFFTSWLRRLMPVRIRTAFDLLERVVVTDFLMAVGFFETEMVSGQIVRYHGLTRIESNSFARFD
jgi:hypothetical protein